MNPLIRSSLLNDGLFLTRPVLLATLVHGLVTALTAMVAMAKSVVIADSEFRMQQAKVRHQSFTEPLAVAAAISLGVSAAIYCLRPRMETFFSRVPCTSGGYRLGVVGRCSALAMGY